MKKRAKDDNPDEQWAKWCWDRGYARNLSAPVDRDVFRAWLAMLSRCYNPADPDYEFEGAKGVTVCDDWNPDRGGSFYNFQDHMGPMPMDVRLESRT